MKPITIILLICIIAMMALLLSGCMTADKATGYLSAHRETAAGYCAAQFPVKTITTVEVREDTAGSNRMAQSLNDYKDSVLTKAAEKNDSIDKLKATISRLQAAGAYTQATSDVLQAQLRGIKPVDATGLRKSIEAEIRKTIVPCRDSIVHDVVENTAKSDQERLRADRLQTEKDAATDGRDWWRKAALITWGIILLYLVLRFFASKVGIISKFIK